MLELGKKAPDFELPDQNGEVHKLSDYLGKKIILYHLLEEVIFTLYYLYTTTKR